MSKFYNDSIFWIEVEKIKPNPYQPRTEFDEAKLKDLASSIRQYGVLQPLVVTRKEIIREDGITSEYELIAGERRLRASKIAGLVQVPAIIRNSEEDSRVKLELAIIENLQREDLNPIDRAIAFGRLAEEFNFKHAQIAEKVGKSREYVTNTIRLLMLPEDMKNALAAGSISEGHTRPLLMLIDRPEEQSTLFKEIVYKKLTVREAEGIARRIAYDRVRKKERAIDPEIVELEEELSESFGTRVIVESKEVGGKITIEFFSDDDLRHLLNMLNTVSKNDSSKVIQKAIEDKKLTEENPENVGSNEEGVSLQNNSTSDQNHPIDDRSAEEKKEHEEEDLYGLDKFSI